MLEPTLELEQLLDDELKEAAVLRRRGYAQDAQMIERLVARVHDCAEDYITWLSEEDAALRSGKSRAWFRRHFSDWETRRLGRRTESGKREYRLVIVPHRAITFP